MMGAVTRLAIIHLALLTRWEEFGSTLEVDIRADLLGSGQLLGAKVHTHLVVVSVALEESQ